MTNVHEKMSNVQEQVANAVEKMGEAAQNVGQKFSDFFQGNPFETAVGRKIELATDSAKLATENWGLNMEICDFVNCTNDGPRDAIRAIKKRLQTQMGKDNAIVMYTLTVLETCVKNCDMRFTVLVCQKEFVAELVKLISAKYDAPLIVQERVLALIQSWADAFRGNPSLSGVVEMYDELKSKGVEFPATDLDAMAPIITPKQTVYATEEEQQEMQNGQNFKSTAPFTVLPSSHSSNAVIVAHKPTGPIQLAPEQMAKLRSELDIVHVNIQVLRELLAQMKPAAAGGSAITTNAQEQLQSLEDFHFIQELYTSCKEMQQRILDLIPAVTNEEVSYELLSVNDELNAAFEKYDRCMTNFSQQGIDVTMIPSGSGTSVKQPQQPIGNLIQLDSDNGTEKPLGQKFEELDIQNNGDQKTTSGLSNEAFIHDQADVGIYAVAFNKPDSPMEQIKDEGKGSKKPEAEDDGL